MYRNARNARDPPRWVSGDETVTRLYSLKASDIRMRTGKKNESGILNQNICGSNVGYLYREAKHPIGGGYTFANISYPGKIYNLGSTFREQDMGKLLFLIFQCDEYFRYRDMELITDSHFGHLVPIAFCRLWKIHCTSSVLVSRKGISGIDFLSKEKLSKDEIKNELDSIDTKEEVKAQEEGNVEEDNTGALGYCEPKKKRITLKTKLDIFEHKLRLKPKGSYLVYKTDIVVSDRSMLVYLHAVHDSKIVYRLSTKYAAKPSVPLKMTVKDRRSRKKQMIEAKTSEAHRTFRKHLGHNDQSDGKRSRIGLSSRYYKRWPQKPFAKTWEDWLINCYLNSVIDPSFPIEGWHE